MTQMFSQSELAGMRDTQQGHMMDTCYILRYSATQDTTGEPIETYTPDANPVICGLEMQAGSERQMPNRTVLEWDAVMRFPILTDINPKDRVSVVTQNGEAITPMLYAVQSPIRKGASGIRVLLRRVEI